MSTLKNTYEHVGSTSSNLWTWKQVIYEYWEDNYLITNESTIVVKSYIGRASNAPKQYGYYSGNATLQTICNGESKSDGIRYYSHGYEGSSDNIGPGEYIEIDEKSFTVKHNSDGTKTLDVSTSLSTSSFSPSSASAIGTITLSTIPRASVFRDLGVVPVGSTVDDGIKFLIDKYYSGFYNKVELYYYNRLNSTWTLLSTEYDVNDGSVVTFTNNELNTLYANQPQQTKSFFKAELFTYTDNTYETMIDSNPDANTIVVRLVNFNLISPTFNGILYHDGNPTTVLLTQDDSIMVKGYSTLYIEIPYSYRAIANTRQTEMSHYVINGNSYPYNPSGSIDIPNDFENYDKDYVTSYAVDKRGVSSTMFNQYFGDNHFLNYSGITKDDGQSYSRNLNGVGPEVTINFSGKWWGDRPFGNNQDAVTNSLQASYKFKKTSASNYITGTTSIVLTLSKENPDDTYYTEYSFSGRINGDTSNNFDISETYDIIVTVYDKLSSVDISFTIMAGDPAIAIYKNKVALGAKYDELLGGLQANGSPLAFYPIGAIYMSVDPTYPGTIFGGTWSQIKDTFLLAAGDYYAGGSTGGEETVTLTVDEMPSHNHSNNTSVSNTYGYAVMTTEGNYLQTGTGGPRLKEMYDTGLRGGSQPHNNMPPYLVVYVWKRIS